MLVAAKVAWRCYPQAEMKSRYRGLVQFKTSNSLYAVCFMISKMSKAKWMILDGSQNIKNVLNVLYVSVHFMCFTHSCTFSIRTFNISKVILNSSLRQHNK